MDVHCTTCGEPWDTHHLQHDAIHETDFTEAEIADWKRLPSSHRLRSGRDSDAVRRFRPVRSDSEHPAGCHGGCGVDCGPGPIAPVAGTRRAIPRPWVQRGP